MIGFIKDIKIRIGLTISSLLSALGAGSSAATAVCQTTCSAGSALPFFLGFTLSATPLAFIENFQLPLWWIAFAVFSLLTAFYVKKLAYSKTDKALLFLNAGLLIIGFPYFHDKLSLLPWVGLGITILGLYLLIAKTYYYKADVNMKKEDIKSEKEAGWEFTLPQYAVNPLNWILVILIVVALILSLILVGKVTNKQSSMQTTTQSQ